MPRKLPTAAAEPQPPRTTLRLRLPSCSVLDQTALVRLMGRNLKNSFVFATLAFLTACQTPQASNQQDRPARTGQSSSPSSQYEVEPISGIQRPLGAPGTFQPGSGRGP